MSANSLSHLLHANAGPDAHRSSAAPDSSYAIPTTSVGPPSQSQPPQHHRQHFVTGPAANSYPAPAPAPPASSLPPAPVSQAPPNPTAQPAGLSPHNSTGASLQTPAARSHSLTQSLYQCADCQRRYSRPEHLARHIQTQLVLPAHLHISRARLLSPVEVGRRPPAYLLLCDVGREVTPLVNVPTVTDPGMRTAPWANVSSAKSVARHLRAPTCSNVTPRTMTATATLRKSAGGPMRRRMPGGSPMPARLARLPASSARRSSRARVAATEI